MPETDNAPCSLFAHAELARGITYHSSHAMAAPQVVCPGDRLVSVDDCSSGAGTYVRDGYVYASLVGVQEEATSADAAKPTLQVVSKQAAPALPQIGNVVTAKVTRVSPTTTNVDILCVGTKALDVEFKGTIRLQDVRATEIDKVVMYDCFRPGDVVRCEVLSLGDARSYYLTTAKNELGVVYAKSVAGSPMVPISWQEMQCPTTKMVERRKVAKLNLPAAS